VLGLLQFTLAARFARDPSARKARHLFYMTLLYLPLLWLFMGVSHR
jgi:hypothetical protein